MFIADEKAMLDFAASLAKQTKPGKVIFLTGNLGAGKTTFVRGFLRGLGYQGTVKSPTYTLVEHYLIDHLNIYHFDLYRLTDPLELEDIGYRDYLHGDNICLIEWPEKAGKLLTKSDIAITITVAENGCGRNLTLK